MSQAVAVATREETMQGKGGVEIFVRSWRPDGPARGVVAIVHGFNSHGGHYPWVAEQLVDRGFAVYALDLRGRGKSGGERFWVDEFADYLSDVHALVTLARSRERGAPVFVLGHSAGGVISSCYALEHQAELAGLICESFAFQVYAPDFALFALKGLSRIVPRAHVLKLPNPGFSRDPKVVAAMNSDPLIANENQPAHTVAEMLRGTERLAREFPLIKLPVLILHGAADKVTRPGGSQRFYDNAGSKDKTLKLYDGHVHDLLNDLGKEKVMADIAGWIEARVSAR
jgi:alpha-beta hydrolase superfamily lysophospholipase